MSDKNGSVAICGGSGGGGNAGGRSARARANATRVQRLAPRGLANRVISPATNARRRTGGRQG